MRIFIVTAMKEKEGRSESVWKLGSSHCWPKDNRAKMFHPQSHQHNISIKELLCRLTSTQTTTIAPAIPLTNFILIWLLMPQAIDTIHFDLCYRILVTEPTTTSSLFDKMWAWNYYPPALSPSLSFIFETVNVIHANGKRWNMECERNWFDSNRQ